MQISTPTLTFVFPAVKRRVLAALRRKGDRSASETLALLANASLYCTFLILQAFFGRLGLCILGKRKFRLTYFPHMGPAVAERRTSQPATL